MKWKLRDRISEKDTELFKYYPEIIARALFHRGIRTIEEAKKYFEPKYEEDLHDPFLMTDMMKATLRIISAINNKERIVIYGDYDCDGIPASAILHNFFKKIGFNNFEVYIPHRHNEGYGMNIGAVNELCSRGADIFITVDCGVTDIEAIDEANSLGADVIVTDHHEPKEILPKAFAVVDPKRVGDKYPCKMLSGSGVAFKLVQALLIIGNFEVREGWEKWLLDMAGLGTIADMVPLQGENRTIAKFGLSVLRKTKRPGLQKLYENMRIVPHHITEEDIGFSIAPRINAAGRMGVPSVAFTFVSSMDNKEASSAYEYLENKNIERKNLVTEVMKEALNIVDKISHKNILFVGKEGWNPGILGLVAGKLSDEFGKTVFVWGGEGETLKGSCRSDGSISLVKLMSTVPSEIFVDFGGHHLAGGFSLSKNSVFGAGDILEGAYMEIADEKIDEELAIDEKIRPDDVSWKIFDAMEKMAPFGVSNTRPVFLFEHVEIYSVKKFGKKSDHFQIEILKDEGGTISAYDFFIDENSFPNVSLRPGKFIDLVATIEKNNFGRSPNLRLKIVDIHPVK
ncbi:MAG: Single-stranded-DNA-specific exonuclease RecJ [Parcubacteria group bacterium GW2011_GWF2_38_76]|nr:MAG: Single-stranded-DNA-specific exonuclease RecJ [Parcubacteria group bacterium GW2011_GWF2_38_76]HBM46214.1 single-stranded-DNA-specific exonuclease RecJ [Patescibacteria group bacterium]